MGTTKITAMGLSLALLAGCGASRQAAWDVKEPTQQAQTVAPSGGSVAAPAGDPARAADSVKAGDDHWQKRADRAELEAAIASWEQAIAANAGDGVTLAKLARANYLLADGWLFFDGEAARARFLKTYERGLSFAERALVALSADFKRRVQAGEKVEEAVGSVDKNGIEALYWYAANLGKWSNASGFTTVLKNKNRYQKVMERVLALDENFFYGAAHRALGVVFAKAPAIAGGDMDKAKQHFDRALQIAPEYQGARVLWAEFYATKAEDKTGYRRELQHVLDAKDDVLPDVVAETQLAKRQAKKLLEQIDEKF
jgi:tetratricopeptide (TPR) repeat protein